MNLLIIPDIHTKVDLAQRIIDKHINEVDQVVLLGDYVDEWNDNAAIMLHTLEYVGKWQQNDRIVLLCGNHEAAYMHPRMRCRGWDEAKQWAWDLSIQLKKFDPKGFATHWYVDDLLLTHAGLAEGRDLISQVDKLGSFIQNNIYHVDLDYHFRDGGLNDIGSIITSRPQYNTPSRKYKQIFGHTPQKKVVPEYYAERNFWYANVDTNLESYVIVDTNNLEELSIQQSPTP